MTTPKKLTETLDGISIVKDRISEQEITEMISIFKGQKSISVTQDLCFISIIRNYNGNNKKRYIDEYNIIKKGDLK